MLKKQKEIGPYHPKREKAPKSDLKRPAVPATRFWLHQYVRTSSTVPSENATFNNRPNYVVTGVRSLSKDPSYKLKIRKRIDASLPYTFRGYDSDSVIPTHIRGAAYQGVSGPGGYRRAFEFDFNGSVANVTLPLPVTDSALADVALARLKGRLDTSVNRMNQLIPAVELREMRGLIRGLAEESIHAAYTLALIAAKAKKKPLAVVNELRQEFQRVWLTYSFGIAPTIGAVSDLCDQIEQKITDRPPAVRLYAGARRTWVTYEDASSTYMNYWQLHANLTHFHELSYRYIAGFNPSVLSSENYGMAAQFGFQVSDLPSVGWELTPFSWMFDYFSNMSKFLSDTFVCPAGFTTYCVLVKKYTRRTIEEPYFKRITNDGSGGYSKIYPFPTNGQRDYVEFVRSPVSALPRLGFHINSVDQVASNAVYKLLNVCSLVKSGRTIHSL